MPAKIPVQKLIDSNKLVINDGYRAKNVELSKCGLPFARAQNINNGFHFDNADYFPVEDIKKVGIKVSRPGDVVFTSKGTVGRLAFVCKDTPKFVYAPQLCFWRSLNHQEILPRWLYYWMHSSEFYAQYKGVSGQTDMAEYVSLYDQRNMSITVPSLNTQKRIAEILGSLDDKIELNRKQNETLEAMARAVFQSWFVDFDPVIDNALAAGHPIPDELAERAARRKHHKNKPPLPQAIQSLFPDRFEPSPLGPIPKGWKVKQIRDVTICVTKGDTPRDSAMQSASKDSRMVNMLRVNAITENGEVLRDKLLKIPESIHFGKSKRSILRENYILYTNAGTIGRVALVDGDILPANTNQAIAIIQPDEDKISPKFLYMLVRDSGFQEILHYDIVQAVQANLALGKIADALFVCPPNNILHQQMEPMEKMLDKVSENRKENKILTQLRDSLLPKLLTGEIEV